MGRDPNFWRWNIVRSVIIVFGEPVDVVVVDVQYAGDVADASPTRTNGPEQGPPRKMRKPCCLGNVFVVGRWQRRGKSTIVLPLQAWQTSAHFCELATSLSGFR